MKNYSIDSRTFDIMREFLTLSFRDIANNYEGLTSDEKALCSKEEFDKLIEFMDKNK